MSKRSLPPSKRPERKKPTLVLAELSPAFSDAELVDVMHQFRNLREQCRKDVNVVVTIAGFDDDPRCLGAIPEARTFCDRLVRLGLIADLEPSTTIVPDDFWRQVSADRPLGSLEVWAISQGLWATHPGENTISTEA